jgi:O-antigen/teichoic acid export membrane protein
MAAVIAAVTLLTVHLREPMQRSAVALITGSVLTSVLGFVFWALAARLYDPAAVGTATALIAAMTFLANLSTLGLRTGLIRFLPTAGSGARALIRRSILTCTAAAGVAAAVFVAGQPLWAPDLEMLRSSPGAALAFLLATITWLVFVLQDAILTGLRRATWVPIGNTAYSILKILVLLALTGAAAWGVFVASVVPAAALAVAVAMATHHHLKMTECQVGESGVPTLSALARFAAGDHLAAMLWLGTITLLPLIVMAEAGPSGSAYYYLAWNIAYMFYLVSSNVGNAFIAAAASAPDRVEELARRAVGSALLLVVPGVAVGLVAAPFLLQVLGADYARESTGLLRLLMLSAIPQVILAMAASTARIRRRTTGVVTIYTALAILIFGGTTLALRTIGLTGVGLVWLAAQILMSAVLLATQMSFLWRRAAQRRT